VVAAGGSAGHIHPSLSLIRALRQRSAGIKVTFISGKKKLEADLLKECRLDGVISVDLKRFDGWRSFLLPSFYRSYLGAFTKSRKVCSVLKPEVVIGFGGAISVPVITAAKTMGIKTLIHGKEQ